MSYFITKYALTTGIFEVSESQFDNRGEGMLSGRQSSSHVTEFFHGEGKEWHRTKELAIARAEELRKAKIASLKKTLAKIEALDFTKGGVK